MKGYINQTLRLLLLALAFNQVNLACAMKPKIFAPTGKIYGSENWNVGPTPPSMITQNPLYDTGLDKLLYENNDQGVKEALEKNAAAFPLNEPSILLPIGRGSVEYFYPIEYAILRKTSVACLEAILKMGSPVNDLEGYNPLKHVLDQLLLLTLEKKLTNQKKAEQAFNEEATRLEGYIALLIRYGANPNLFRPYDGREIGQICTGSNTAHQCLDALVKYYTQRQQDITQFGWRSAGAQEEEEEPRVKLVLASLQRIQSQFGARVLPSQPLSAPNPQPAPRPQGLASTAAPIPQSSTSSTASLAPSKIFNPTGKQYYSPGWRLVEERPSDVIYNAKKDVHIKFLDVMSKDDVGAVKQFIQNNKTFFTDEPSIITSLTPRSGPYYFRYPIEEFIRFGNYPTTSFNALLQANPQFVNGFPDYNPLKDILERMTNPAESYDHGLLGYARSLIENAGIDLDTPFPNHNGYGPDTSGCNNCSARQYIERKKDQVKAEARNAFKTIADLINAKPPRQQIVQPIIPQQQKPVLTASIASTSQIKQQQPAPITAPTESIEQQKRSWEQWCAQTTSPFAKKTICAMVLGTAAVAVGAKLAYRRWMASKPATIRADLKVTVKNNTGIDAWLTMHKQDGTVIEISFNNSAVRSEPAVDIAQLSIVLQDTAKTYLPINLKAYLSHPQSQDSDLEITLLPVTGWWRFWYRSPYRYEVKWQAT